jgi:ribosomal protein L11
MKQRDEHLKALSLEAMSKSITASAKAMGLEVVQR